MLTSLEQPRFRSLFAATLALLSHGAALFAGFIWTDHGDLESGAALLKPGEALHAFTQGYARTGFYRPLTVLSLSLDSWWGQGAWVFHLTSLSLHAAASVLVGVVAAAFGVSRRGALFASALFAVHPVTGLVANAIPFRGDALVTCLLLVLLWAARSDKPVVAGVAMLLAGFSKETAFILGPPFALLAMPKRSVKTLVAVGAGWALPAALRFGYAPSWHQEFPPLTALDAIGTRLAGVGKSALAIVFPFPPSVCDAFAIQPPWTALALCGLVALLACGYFGVRRRGLALALCLALIPALNVVPVPRFWSPHYLYLPLALILMLVAPLLERFRRSPLVVALLLVAFWPVTQRDAARYKNDTTFFTRELEVNPQCREAQFYLGDALRQAGELERAGRELEASVTPHPGLLAFVDESAAQTNLGIVRLRQGQLDKANAAFTRALELEKKPLERRKVAYNLAAVEFAQQNFAGAARRLEPEVDRQDALPEAVELYLQTRTRMGETP